MKKRIYVFSAPQFYGGGEVFLVRLAKLLGLGPGYTVVSPDVPALQLNLEAVNARFVKLPGTRGIVVRFAFFSWLWQHRKEIRDDAASFVLNGRGAGYFAPAVRLLTGIRPVVICHTELLSKKKSSKEFLFGIALRFSRCSIAVSRTVAIQLRERWPALDVHAIPNWIDRPTTERKFIPAGLNSTVIQIAVVGRLDESKGIDDAASVFAVRNDIEAHFYGDGTLRSYLEGLASKAPWIRIHGHVDDIESRLQCHAILVSASYSESFSYSVAEGIYAGLLCVISDIPAHRELLGPDYPGTLYFSPGSAEGLGKALDAAKQMFGEMSGQQAQRVVQRAQERMRTCNAPAEARKCYRTVLFGVSTDTFANPKKISSHGNAGRGDDQPV